MTAKQNKELTLPETMKTRNKYRLMYSATPKHDVPAYLLSD